MNKEILLKYDTDQSFTSYQSLLDGDQVRPGLIVIHEIWGLNEHTKDLCRRFSEQGYDTIAPDLLSETGILEKISPAVFAEMHDPEKKHAAQAKMREAMQPIYTEEFSARSIQKLKACVDYLLNLPTSNGKIGVVGFCFGGTYSFHLAINDPRLNASVVFYGQAPAPIESVALIHCPVLAFYGEQDERLITSLPELTAAMKKYDKDFSYYIYPNTGHAFFNDTNAQAYNKEAADDAWEKSIEFLERNLRRE